MKILSQVVFADSQQVKAKCMNPRQLDKEEQGEDKKNV